MRVFVWIDLDRVTSNYHPEGSVVVFAETVERAREIALAWEDPADYEQKPGYCVIPADCPPVESRVVEGGEEAIYVMPDAGCC